jgi:hypothetical protein
MGVELSLLRDEKNTYGRLLLRGVFGNKCAELK